MYQELNNDNLEEIVATGTTTFVQFSAGWCGNCKLMKPKFKMHASEHESINFAVVDAENSPKSRRLAEVTNLPTFAAFKNGQLVKQIQTNKPDLLKQFVDEITNN
ncbi:MAG: thioredoxin family protein [Cyclobacteriaceae bacterium]|nr:thioredoxin family protein [Cyclobacteriaceae bacterium]